MESNRGTGPAPSGSRDYLAPEKSEWEIDPSDADDAAVAEINTLFRLKLVGLRRRPRHERPHILRAAREVRDAAIREVRERRAYARHARYMLRRLKRPTPG